MILAVGNSGAHEVETFQLVVKALQDRGVNRVTLYRQDKCLENDFLTYEVDSNGRIFRVVIDGRPYDIEEFTAIWFLRPHLPRELMSFEPAKYRQLISRQFLEMRQALWSIFQNKKWINEPWAEYKAENKMVQLAMATEAGLQIPSTVVTSDPTRIRAFYREHSENVIFKLLAPSVVMDEVMFTNRLTPEGLENIDSLKQAPAIFQSYVEKAYELRITIVGSNIFAVKVDSQADKETALDWRRSSKLNDFNVKMEQTDLPPVIQRKLLFLLDKLGLRFGCIDMIVTPQGDYVFLEINPGGQWYFIQQKTRARIADAIADLLS